MSASAAPRRVFIASMSSSVVVDVDAGSTKQVNWDKAFDVAYYRGLLYVAHHTGPESDRQNWLSFIDPDKNQEVGHTPPGRGSVEGSIVVEWNELFLACGHHIQVHDAKPNSLKSLRQLTIPGYCNGPMATSDEGLWVMLGEFLGTDEPQVKEGTVLALIDPRSGQMIRQVEVNVRWS
jgi:hypothetical protein